MMENGREILEMATEFKSGLMEPNMKATGSIIVLVEKANFTMLMAISLKENGRTTRQMAMELINISMVLCMKEIGGTTSSMDGV